LTVFAFLSFYVIEKKMKGKGIARACECWAAAEEME
jgi:hypothetical protein